MARKNIKILSGGVTILCIVLFCCLDINVQAGFVGQRLTYTISGSVGVSGVTMRGLPGAPVVSDENGYYAATVNHGWNGTVTPIKDGYTFRPANKIYTNVTSDLGNEDYQATLMTFTISGTTGMDGVEMNGLPGNPVTGSDGTYSATVDYGWSGTVTPTREGYKFTPAYQTYTPVTKNQTNQNYTAAEITFTVSGSAGAPGVVMNGLPNNPISGKDGTYSAIVKYGFTGTVTPTKEGYEFNPPSMQYADTISAQTNQDYIATLLSYTISGTTGLAGVEIKGLPGNPVTDENGFYRATVDYGWSGTATPVREGYTFEPASMSYSKVISERDNQSYVPTMITLTISGKAGYEGVEMNGLPGNPVTGSDGSYSATVDYGFSGTVTPSKEGYKFTPPNMTYGLIVRDQTNQNYTAARMTFTISGNAGGVAGAVMNGFPDKPVSSRDGTYSATVEYGFTGEVTPEKEGYEFDPPSRSYTDLISAEINQNYTATLLKRTLSGRIISDKGQPVEGVSVSADNEGGTGTTSPNGEFTLEVDYAWRGSITPMKEGHTFKPANKTYGAVTRDQMNQSFTAILKTFTISGEVIIGNTPIEGVTIAANNEGGSDTTDAEGKYSVTVPYGWSGEVTPTKEGFVFDPRSEAYANVTCDYKNGQAVLPKPVAPPTPPKPVTPTPPTPITPTPPTPGAELVIPKTPLEQDIARIQAQLEELLRQQAAGEAGPPPTAVRPGRPSEAEQILITNTFSDSELVTEILPSIASAAGISIIPDETVTGLVTCELKGVPLDTALEIVLAGTPFIVKKTPYYYLVCSGDVKSSLFSRVSDTRRIKLNYLRANTAVALLSTPFKDYVQADPNGSTVCVTAAPDLMDRIIADLKLIDKLPPHVMLDARIVVMERGDLLNLGVEWSWPNVQIGMFGSDHKGFGSATMPGPGYGAKWPWGVQIGYTPEATFTNALELALNLLSENGEASILAKPQVLAQDGREAQIQVMTEEWYMMTSPETNYFYSRSELQSIESGTKLSITPHIGDNNDITLEMAVEVSDSIPRGRGSDLPVVTRRTASNTVRIKDGGTVAVAGLTENRTSLSKRRVPGLGNLPILGPLFNNTSSQKSTREIAVFVTAHIVPEHSRTVEFSEKSATQQDQAEPVGEEFRAGLREVLSRSIR